MNWHSQLKFIQQIASTSITHRNCSLHYTMNFIIFLVDKRQFSRAKHIVAIFSSRIVLRLRLYRLCVCLCVYLSSRDRVARCGRCDRPSRTLTDWLNVFVISPPHKYTRNPHRHISSMWLWVSIVTYSQSPSPYATFATAKWGTC